MPRTTGDVEIWTDAANRFGFGAWAAVGLRPKDPSTYFEDSGALRVESPSSTLHELQAVANGLHRAELLGLLRDGDLVVIRTDCLGNIPVINGLTISRKPKREGANEVVRWISRLCKRKSIRIKAKHVKGHQPVTSLDAHAANNRRCDKLCTLVLKSQQAEPVAPPPPSRAVAIRKRLAAAELAGIILKGARK